MAIFLPKYTIFKFGEGPPPVKTLVNLHSAYGNYEPEEPLAPREEWGTKDKFKKYRWRRTKKGRKRSRRCQAFSKNRIREGLRNQHAQCPHFAVKGSNYCRWHGGGREVPALTIDTEMDRYAQHLPQDLKNRYFAAKSDPELLSARNEVELMTARIGQVLERLETGESGQAWQQVIEAEIVLRQALRSNSPESLMMGLRTAHSMLRDATKKTDTYVWRELEGLLHSRTKLADVESSRLIAQKQFLTVEQLVSIAADLQREMYTVITDMQMRRQITQIFRGTFLGQDSDIPQEGLEDDRYRWGTQEGQRGCYICYHKEFRMRNCEVNGWYKCPYCQTAWEPAMQEPDDTVIDVQPLQLEAGDLEANPIQARTQANTHTEANTQEPETFAFTDAADSATSGDQHHGDAESNTSIVTEEDRVLENDETTQIYEGDSEPTKSPSFDNRTSVRKRRKKRKLRKKRG